MTARWRMPPEKWCGQSFMRSSARSMPTRRISSSTRSRTAARESPGAWTRTAGLCGLAFVPFFLLVTQTYDPKRVVDGANDNLSGCCMGIALLREMERLGITPEHTEIGVILTGSEEAGLRGAKAWVAAHKGEYRDVPTYIVS